jgi:hypothetical protein
VCTHVSGFLKDETFDRHCHESDGVKASTVEAVRVCQPACFAGAGSAQIHAGLWQSQPRSVEQTMEKKRAPDLEPVGRGGDPKPIRIALKNIN